MEKNNVNILEDKTKDGIHLIFGIQMHKAYQLLIREKIIRKIKRRRKRRYKNYIEEI